MILVEKPPNILPAPACPATRVRIINRLDKTLRVASYDMLTNVLVGETTYNIDSDDKTLLVYWATPESRSLMLAVLEVLDGTTVIERWAQPFIYIPNASVLNLPSSDYDVVYISKVGGVTKFISNTSTAFLDPMCIVVIRKKGYLAIYDGSTKIVEVSGKSAFFELAFQVSRDVARAFANYVDNDNVISVVYKEYTLAEYLGALAYVKQLVNSLRFTNVGTTVYDVEDGYFIVKCRFYADLYSQIDWHRILAVIAGIAGVVAGVLLALASGGVSLPASYSIIIASISMISGTALVMTTLLHESPSDVVKRAEELTLRAIEEINKYKSDLYSYLDTLVAQGRITADEANTVKSYVESITSTAEESIKELNELVKKAYKEGYNKAKAEQLKWIVLSGVGGFIGGLVCRKD